MGRIDRYQQSHAPLAFVVAVLKKFADDEGGQLAGLIAFYAFMSIFPLLLVFGTVLAFVLQDDPSAQRAILSSTVSDVPVIGRQIRDNIHSLHGSLVALAAGGLTATWAGMGVTNVSQSALNRVWYVPHRERPDFLGRRVRGLALLVGLGTLGIVSAALTALAREPSLGFAGELAGHVLAAAAAVVLFGLSFRLLTAAELSWCDLWPGTLLAAASWQLLAEGGAFLVTHNLRHASELYGTFGFVLGLIATLLLATRMAVIAAEVNVVRARRLWPRSLSGPLTSGDRRALEASAESEERVAGQDVQVTFR